jgi:hypothetical protein
MVSKKKDSEETKPLKQGDLFASNEPQAQPSAPPISTPPAAPAPLPTSDPTKIESPAFLEKIRADATLWAKECGLKPPFIVNGPERMNYPKMGHGYVVTIKEETGKERLGSARFNSNGAPTYWSLDGIVTG